MDKSQGQKDANQPKRRRTQSKYNKDSTRYECFCAKQYLSYPALYLHLKNKHPNYFMKTKGQHKVENTRLVQSQDSNEGYRVLKIPVSEITMQEFDRREPIATQPGDIVRHGQNSQLFFGNYMYHFPPINFDFFNQNTSFNTFPWRFMSIEVAFTAFTENLSKESAKQRMEVELLLSLLIECLNGNYHRLQDERTRGKEVRRYTAEFTCDYVSRIFSYFDKDYLPRLKQQQNKPFTFFLNNSQIITSESYKNVLIQLNDFLSGKAAERDTSERESPEDGTPNQLRADTNKSNSNSP